MITSLSIKEIWKPERQMRRYKYTIRRLPLKALTDRSRIIGSDMFLEGAAASWQGAVAAVLARRFWRSLVAYAKHILLKVFVF